MIAVEYSIVRKVKLNAKISTFNELSLVLISYKKTCLLIKFLGMV